MCAWLSQCRGLERGVANIEQARRRARTVKFHDLAAYSQEINHLLVEVEVELLLIFRKTEYPLARVPPV